MNNRLILIVVLMIGSATAFAADLSAWITVSPTNAGFSAVFPVVPKYTLSSKPDSDGHIWMATSADENLWVLGGATDYWVHINTERELELDQTNFLEAIKGTATSTKRDTFPGPGGNKTLPSRVFDFTTEDLTGRSRVIVDGDTAFQWVVMWKRGYDATAALALFERSYKLLPRVRPPHETPKLSPTAKSPEAQ